MNKPDWMPADAQPVTLYNKPGSASGKETSPNPGSCSRIFPCRIWQTCSTMIMAFKNVGS